MIIRIGKLNGGGWFYKKFNGDSLLKTADTKWKSVSRKRRLLVIAYVRGTLSLHTKRVLATSVGTFKFFITNSNRCENLEIEEITCQKLSIKHNIDNDHPNIFLDIKYYFLGSCSQLDLLSPTFASLHRYSTGFFIFIAPESTTYQRCTEKRESPAYPGFIVMKIVHEGSREIVVPSKMNSSFWSATARCMVCICCATTESTCVKMNGWIKVWW